MPIMELYTEGVENVGWTGVDSGGNATKEATYLKIYLNADSENAYFRTTNAINFSPCHTLTVDWEFATSSNRCGVDFKSNTITTYDGTSILDHGGVAFPRDTVEYDVSAITGNQYLFLRAHSIGSYYPNTSTLKIHRVWLIYEPVSGGAFLYNLLSMRNMWEEHNKIFRPKGILIPEGI